MTTSISSPTPYCTPNQSLAYVDARQWGDVLLDNNTRERQASLPNDAYFNEQLLAAAGDIEAACLAGERYTILDLQGLTGASAAYLRKLNAWLCYGNLFMRRRPASAELPVMATWAFNVLDQLRSGARIFSLQAPAAAGLQTHGCTTGPSVQARRYFGGSHFPGCCGTSANPGNGFPSGGGCCGGG